MKQITLSVLVVALGIILCGCPEPEDAKEISTQEFFDLRMKNDWQGKAQSGWFILDDKTDFILIGLTSAKLAPGYETKWTKYRKCKKGKLTEEFPAFQELDGVEIRKRVFERIKPIQDEQLHNILEINGSGGVSQELEWSYNLTESNIVGEVIWDYTVGPPPTKHHYEFSFTITNDRALELEIIDKNSNQGMDPTLKTAQNEVDV